MTERPRRVHRRYVLTLLSVCGIGGLAGCNQFTDGNNDDNSNDETDTSNPDISVSISTEAQPSQLPSIWDNQDIEDFQARFSVETSGQPTNVTVSNDKVEIGQDSEQWNQNMVMVQPGQMRSGEQTFTATAEKNGATAEDTTQASKPTPGNYKVDVVPQRNEELRNTIQQEADEENYLEARGGFVEQDPVFDSYNSHEALSFDKLGVDLVAQEWRHDNDYESLAEGSPVESQQFIDSIDADTGNSDIEQAKQGYGFVYPNGEWGERYGHFDAEKFAEAETVGEALDWIHSYYFNWQRTMTENGPISSEDFIYAPTLEQAIEQKNDNNLEVHAWDFDLDEHGNGLIYGKNADGSDELRVMETIKGAKTASSGDPQLHPLIENSGYLELGTEGFNAYWHPLRFGWEEHSNSQRWEFEGEKRRAAEAVKSMATSTNLSPTAERDQDSSMERAEKVTATTEYLQDFTEKLRTYNQNDAKFESLYDQAKVMNKLLRDIGHNHVIYGDTDNPQYAVVEDEEVVQNVWEDEQGQYDDFDQFLQDNPSYSMSAEEVDATLEGEEIEEDLGQKTLAST